LKIVKASLIISLLMSPLLGPGLPYGLHIRRTGHNPPCGPSACWWVLTTANATGTNGLACLPKHGGARDNKFLVTNPMSNQRCLTYAIARRSALTAGSSSSSSRHLSLYEYTFSRTDNYIHLFLYFRIPLKIAPHW
jgi:hypothetical protein